MKKTIALLLLVSPLHAASQNLLEKAAALLGGGPRFQRVETVSYDFEETVGASTAPARTGRRLIRLHDGGGFRVREESAGPGGARIVVLSSSPWARVDGAPVSDSAQLASMTEALRREVFLDLFPHALEEGKPPISLLPSGFFLGRLMNRAAVGGPPPFSGAEGLVLHLSRDAGRVEGISFGEPVRHLPFSQFQETKSLVSFAARRAVYDDAQKRLSAVVIRNVVVNGFVDENLFQQEGAPQ